MSNTEMSGFLAGLFFFPFEKAGALFSKTETRNIEAMSKQVFFTGSP